MDIKSLAQAELAKIIAAHPSVAVAVVVNGKTVLCVKSAQSNTANLSDNGEVGVTTGAVRGNADSVGVLAFGQTITVNGKQAFVMNHEPDSVGATVKISYQLQRPINFSMTDPR